MAQNVSKLPSNRETRMVPGSPFRAFEHMRRQIDRMFDNFGDGFWTPARTALEMEPVWRRDFGWEKVPAVDVAEKENAYEITAELPGMDEKDIEITVADGVLTIKGEKKEQNEEKQKDYYVSERHYGYFARSFRIPENADAGKIDAKFQKGVLAVTLAKVAEVKKPEQKIEIKAA